MFGTALKYSGSFSASSVPHTNSGFLSTHFRHITTQNSPLMRETHSRQKLTHSYTNAHTRMLYRTHTHRQEHIQTNIPSHMNEYLQMTERMFTHSWQAQLYLLFRLLLILLLTVFSFPTNKIYLHRSLGVELILLLHNLSEAFSQQRGEGLQGVIIIQSKP